MEANNLALKQELPSDETLTFPTLSKSSVNGHQKILCLLPCSHFLLHLPPGAEPLLELQEPDCLLFCSPCLLCERKFWKAAFWCLFCDDSFLESTVQEASWLRFTLLHRLPSNMKTVPAGVGTTAGSFRFFLLKILQSL